MTSPAAALTAMPFVPETNTLAILGVNVRGNASEAVKKLKDLWRDEKSTWQVY
jgi:hypothetical protein